MAKLELGVIKLKSVNNRFTLDLTDNQKELCQDIFRKCKKNNNGYIRVLFSSPKKKRSTGKNSQNSHLNGHIQQMSEETGNSFDMIKSVVKDRAIDMGYPMLDGELQYDIVGLKRGISEADSSTIECKILIDAVHIIADEMNFKLKED